MKYAIPEISWHNRDPVLSVDFQPKSAAGEPLRLATGGTDSHVLIWYISTTATGSVNLEVAADLTRHQKAVNAVRWSPNGELLASGDDESIIFVWKQKNEELSTSTEGEEQYKETWVIHKTLRGHMEDVLDLSWSADSLHLASGSVDNKLLLWEVSRGRHSNILADHKGFVQGVAWDPRGQFVATASSDRTFRTFDISSKKVSSRSSKATLPFPSDHPLHNVSVRLYHDDTLQTYYRRLSFSPDGLLIAVPAGRIEPEQGKLDTKPINAVYIYTRFSLKVPACVLPCGEAALVTRWSPVSYAPRAPRAAPAAFPLERRMLLAVGTKRSVLLYDTQQRTPIAMISNIHYTRLTDLTWSADGRMLVASSTDGFCSVISFGPAELGDPYCEPPPPPAAPPAPAPATTLAAPPAPPAAEPMEVQTEEQKENSEEIEISPKEDKSPKREPKRKVEPKNTTPTIDSYMKFKTPSDKSPNKKRKTNTKTQEKTPVKLDLLVDTAMQSWSDNSNSELLKLKEAKEAAPDEIMVIEDSEDIKLVYEETCELPKDCEKPQDKSENKADKSQDKAKLDKSPEASKTDEKGTPERKRVSFTPVGTPTSSNFLKQAKVTDVKQSAVKPVSSPKAPRRVSFVTLSSPKNKKKC